MKDPEKQNENENWQFPIPQHHMYAICILLTISLLTAILLPSPEDPTVNENSQWSTGVIPDSNTYQPSIIIADDENATESLDSDIISDQDLLADIDTTTTDTDLDDNSSENLDNDNNAEDSEVENHGQTSDENSEKNQSIVATPEIPSNWLVQTVRKGDNASTIFRTLNIDFAYIKALEKTENYGKSITNLTPGDNIHFLLTPDHKLIELIKPYSKTEQVHYKVVNFANDIYGFTATLEPLGTGFTEDQEEVKTPTTTAAENITADNIAKIKAEEKKRLEEKRKKEELERQKLEEERKKKLAARKTHMTAIIQKKETITTALDNIGLKSTERNKILSILKNHYNPKTIHPGDEIHILFESAKPGSKINAVYFKQRSNKKIALFRNPKDNRYYTEAGTSTKVTKTTGSGFNRYPLANSSNIRVTSRFNPNRLHPITRKHRPHNGTDFGVKVGTPIYAPANGVVVKATYQRAAGNYIIIQHANGYSTVYMHLSRILVKTGQHVGINQRIALSGNTGASTGPHLHYEVRINNRPVDPLKVNLPRSSVTTHVQHDTKFGNQIKQYKRQLGIK